MQFQTKLVLTIGNYELHKYMTLPFVPPIGLRIFLDSDAGSEEEREAYKRSIELHGLLTVGAVDVESVSYYAKDQSLFVKASISGARDMMDNPDAIEQLICGYGFTDWDKWLQNAIRSLDASEAEEADELSDESNEAS